MPNLKAFRTRIESVKNTQKTTSAMKMVSASKLRRAQMNITNLRPYAHRLLQVIADIAETKGVEHPLLSRGTEPKRILAVVLTSDRGMCGGFNSNIIRFTEKWYKENKSKYENIDFIFIGRKANDYFSRRGIKPVDTVLNLAREISYNLAAQVAEKLMVNYVEGKYDEVRLIYNEFKSALTQIIVDEKLLPVDLSKQSFEKNGKDMGFAHDMIFEPSPEEIITALLEKHFTVQVYRCMSESLASEHGARMTAMENATKNAKQFIESLTLTYNKLRQSMITTELIEITSGAEALKN